MNISETFQPPPGTCVDRQVVLATPTALHLEQRQDQTRATGQLIATGAGKRRIKTPARAAGHGAKDWIARDRSLIRDAGVHTTSMDVRESIQKDMGHWAADHECLAPWN